MDASPSRRPVIRVLPPGLSQPFGGGMTTRLGFEGTPAEAGASARPRARGQLADLLGRPPSDLAWLAQVHGARVAVADGGGAQGEGDALVSADPGQVLVISVADCCPVLLWDGPSGVFGIAHAGWRGLVAGVLPATVGTMVRLGARAQTMRAWIGPSIGPCCFEVGEEVAGRFEADCVRPPGRDGRTRSHVDLRRAGVRALVKAGVDPGRIGAAPDCTACRDDLYWSYRRDGASSGRQLAFLHRPR